MRPILVFLVLSAVGCSSYDVCGPSTCDGCCTASGECVSGDLNQACGVGGNACNVCPSEVPTCQQHVCRAAPVGEQDAGPDAGHAPDAGNPQVFVTFRYDYREQKNSGCPPVIVATTCSSIKSMAKAEFDALRLEYPSCSVTQATSDGYEIDCTGNCAGSTMQCPNSTTGGFSSFTEYACTTPKHATAGFCMWTP